MEKIPFTPQGFATLQAELYALPDPALQAEADAVFNDYVSWVQDHVILNADQVTYLEGLAAVFIAQLASRASIAFINRLPLILVLPPNYSATDVGKWFLDGSTIVALNSPGQAVTATGELIYEMQFE